MSDATLRALEQAVRSNPGDEPARVALDIERRRRGMGSLWGYAPRWCLGGGAPPKRATPHLPGLFYDCPGCKVARDESAQHVMTSDAVLNGSDWTRIARANVALVVRVMPPGASMRDVRAALREVKANRLESRWDSAHGRKVWGNEVGRAFPALSRKPKPASVDAPLFGEAVPHAP